MGGKGAKAHYHMHLVSELGEASGAFRKDPAFERLGSQPLLPGGAIQL